MEIDLSLLSLAVIFGFLMAWGIGANDVSNAMGTAVGSKAISLRQAIVIAAIFEFLGAFIAGSEVTNTIQQNIISPQEFTDNPTLFIIGMLASLLSSAIWLLTASFYGWPVSTTHTIIGAIVGFGAFQCGLSAIQWGNIYPMILSWIFSPFLGGILSYTLFSSIQLFIFDNEQPIARAKKIVPIYIFLTSWIILMISIAKLKNLGIYFNFIETAIISSCISLFISYLGKIFINNLDLDPKLDKHFHFTNVEKLFSILMIFTASAMAFAHGSNDVANAIGPVAAIANIASSGNITHNIIPIWILLLGAGGIVIGLATYGHKVIATIGSGITQLTPARGFAVTLATASTVVLATNSGIPVSTTHTLVGGVLGVGLARGMEALNIRAIIVIFSSWLITLPAGGILSIIIFLILKTMFI